MVNTSLPNIAYYYLRARWESWRRRGYRTVEVTLTSGTTIVFAEYLNGRKL